MSDIYEVARLEAVKNAVSHDGSASVDAVMKKAMSQTNQDPGEVIEVVKDVVEEVNNEEYDSLVSELQQKEPDFFSEDGEEDESILPDLPNASDGDVRMRAAPNPNSPWHLGHARMPSVLGTYADMYDGEMIVRFDDTDPANKRPDLDAYDKILDDVEYLGFTPDGVFYASDRMETYYDHARTLIEDGHAYICYCEPSKMSEDRREGVRCDCYDSRNDLNEFERMVNGEFEPQEAVLRIATDINHKNPAVRDWVAFRILNEEHPRDLGDNYDCWPTLDFQSAIDDHELDVTHIIRGIDLQDSEKRQKYIYQALGWEYPEVLHWGRVNVDEYNVPLSSSSINELIESGEIDSWDDPRAPTIASLRRRGIEGEAIVDAMLSLGMSTNDATLSMSELYTRNREIIDSKAPRAFFASEDAETFEIKGGPSVAVVPRNPESDETRSITVGDSVILPSEALVDEGERVWLKGLGCYTLEGSSLTFESEDSTLVESGEVPVGYWVPENNSVQSVVEMPDGSTISGYADETVELVEEGEVVRFGLLGFACLEAKEDGLYRFVFTHE